MGITVIHATLKSPHFYLANAFVAGANIFEKYWSTILCSD